MEKKLIIKKKHDIRAQSLNDDYVEDPEESLDIVEKLRREAGYFVYGNTTSFQRTITVIRKK